MTRKAPAGRPRRRTGPREFDIALSFAGHDRRYAEELASLLKTSGVRVFYDEFFKAALWGKDLYQHLQSIYRDKALYCVVFVSKAYVKRDWTKHELKQAQARAFSSDREYILPLKVDNSLLPGLNHTIGYLDLRKTSLAEVAALLLEKLGKSQDWLTEEVARAKWAGDFTQYNGVQVASFWPEQLEKAQHKPFYLTATALRRIQYGDERYSGRKTKRKNPCHDCAALPGQFHVPGCDMEQCPACGGQNISCDCSHIEMTEERRLQWEERDDNSGFFE